MGRCSGEEAVGLEVGIIEEGVEGGALLEPFLGGDASVAVGVGREVAMSEDEGIGEASVQLLQQLSHAASLCIGARVGREAPVVQSALVADAYRMAVVAAAVGASLMEGPSVVHSAVACDVVMITDVLPATAEVICPALFEGVALRRSRCRAVQDDECDGSHDKYSK